MKDANELLQFLQADEDVEEAPRRAVAAAPVPLPPAVPSAGGADGKDVEDSVADYLEYLSQLCRDLGVPDLVEEYFAPVVGRWSAMHSEAERWRAAGKAADEVSASLTKPLGGLDAAWEGATADSFIAYMQKVGLAGNDMSDAMNSMAEVLDKTADGIREIVTELAGVLADTAESSSQAMNNPAAGEERTRQHLDEMRGPLREFFESVRQVLEAFVNLCDGVDGSKAFEQVKMAHTFPAENWDPKISVPAPVPAPGAGVSEPAGSGAKPGGGGGGAGSGGGGSVGGSVGGGGSVGAGAGAGAAPGPGAFTAVGEVGPAPAQGAAAAAAAAAVGGGGAAGAAGGMGGGGMMMPPMMGAGMGGSQNEEHQNKARLVADPEEIFGEPTQASPSIIGEDD